MTIVYKLEWIPLKTLGNQMETYTTEFQSFWFLTWLWLLIVYCIFNVSAVTMNLLNIHDA